VDPSGGATLSGDKSLTATASAAAVKVEFVLSGGPLNYSNLVLGSATNSSGGWRYVWSTTTVADGSYTLMSRAYDNFKGSAVSVGVPITTDNISANIVIPTNGATVTGTAVLDAGASAAVTRVDYLLSGGPFNKATLGSATPTIYGWLFSWNTAAVPGGITPGSYLITARAYNSATVFDDSAPLLVNIPPVGPAPSGGYAPTVPMDGTQIDFPDPFVFRSSNGNWYAYSTGSGLFTTQVASSPDGVTWHWEGDPFGGGGSSSWASLYANTWAPTVLERPGNPASSRYVMYYASRSNALGTQCIGRATSSSPIGPFVDTSTQPFICQTSEVWSIDPSPYVADDGSVYLVWTSGNPSVTARIWSRQLDPTGLSFAAGTSPTNIFTYGGAGWENPVVEGPTMITDPTGGVFLFYSGNSWPTANYASGVAHCDSPTGSCQRVYTTPLLAARGTMVGPGGGTPFRNAAGGWSFAFHAWESPAVGYGAGGQRSLRILPITFQGGLPKIG
jgi:hypothetical protein